MKTSRGWVAGYAMAIMSLAALATSVTMGQEPMVEQSGASSEGTAKAEDRSNWALQEKNQAITRAWEILGVTNQTDLPANAEIVVLAEDNTPFLSRQIVGRPIWHVVISNWKLDLLSTPPDRADSYIRTCDILLDPRDGKLLSITSRWPGDVPPIAPQPGAASATAQMAGSGNEQYHGFPEEGPPISLSDALDAIQKAGGNPLVAKQILGHYVVWSRMGDEPKPVWAITLRGISPIKAAYPGVSVDARNHLRYIVDPKTRRWICATTTPQPTTLDDKPTKRAGAGESPSVQRTERTQKSAPTPSNEPCR